MTRGPDHQHGFCSDSEISIWAEQPPGAALCRERDAALSVLAPGLCSRSPLGDLRQAPGFNDTSTAMTPKSVSPARNRREVQAPAPVCPELTDWHHTQLNAEPTPGTCSCQNLGGTLASLSLSPHPVSSLPPEMHGIQPLPFLHCLYPCMALVPLTWTVCFYP